MKFEVNEGPADRIIRGVVAVLLFFLAMYLYNIWSIIPAVIGVAILMTAVFGYCGLYTLLGFNTLTAEQREQREKQEKKKQQRDEKKAKKEARRKK